MGRQIVVDMLDNKTTKRAHRLPLLKPSWRRVDFIYRISGLHKPTLWKDSTRRNNFEEKFFRTKVKSFENFTINISKLFAFHFKMK